MYGLAADAPATLYGSEGRTVGRRPDPAASAPRATSAASARRAARSRRSRTSADTSGGRKHAHTDDRRTRQPALPLPGHGQPRCDPGP
jgi:hypothetical protein